MLIIAYNSIFVNIFAQTRPRENRFFLVKRVGGRNEGHFSASRDCLIIKTLRFSGCKKGCKKS